MAALLLRRRSLLQMVPLVGLRIVPGHPWPVPIRAYFSSAPYRLFHPAVGTGSIQWIAELMRFRQPFREGHRRQQMPIVIHSGWLPHEAYMPAEIGGLPWVLKPRDYNTMLKALAKAAPQIILPESMDGTG